MQTLHGFSFNRRAAFRRMVLPPFFRKILIVNDSGFKALEQVFGVRMGLNAKVLHQRGEELHGNLQLFGQSDFVLGEDLVRLAKIKLQPAANIECRVAKCFDTRKV